MTLSESSFSGFASASASGDTSRSLAGTSRVSSGSHIFVSLKQLSPTCHVSLLAAPGTDHKHKFSLTHFIHFSYFSTGLTLTNKPYDSQPIKSCDVPRQSGGSTQIPSLTGYDLKSVEFKNIDAEAIELEDLDPRRIDLQKNLGTDPYQIQARFMRNSITEDMDEFGKFGAKTSYLQSQTHSDYDSAESIGDSDLADGELRKDLASRCICNVEQTMNPLECQSYGRKIAALFSFGSEKPESQFKGSVFNTDPSNLGRNKDHLLCQATFELMRQEHQVESLNCCISEPQQQGNAQRLELQDAQHGYIAS